MSAIQVRLCVMMFLQYFVWGAWAVELGGYLGGVLNFSGEQIGRVYQATAIAAMVSPLFMGYVADRFFSTERLMALLHLAGAVLLWFAATSESVLSSFPAFGDEYGVLRYVMIAYALCYMPTLALSNSISFENIRNPEKEFPPIRLFGTLGWIAAGLVVGLVLKAQAGSSVHTWLTSVLPAESPAFKPSNFIYLAAISSAFLGVYCLTLPYTPPKARGEAVPASQRRSIFALLKDPSFVVFTFCSFLICIPLSFYYSFANTFLQEIKAPSPTALQTIGQWSEVVFMALMPFFIQLLGVKRMLAVGMAAWVLRYLFFSSLNLPLIVVGLVLHGVCYDFFFVASQIYVDSRAEPTQRARAQGFIAFVTLGLGMYLGAEASGYIVDKYAAKAAEVAGTIHDWRMIWLWPALAALATLVLFLVGFRDRRSLPQQAAPQQTA